MDKQNIEEQRWIPHTPMKPIAPIHSNTEERSFVDMCDVNNMSFKDLLALANTASSVHFSGKGNKSVSSVSDNVTEQQFKTPEKPKRRKHRPKVVKEAKPKQDAKLKQEPKPKTPRKKPVVSDNSGQEIKTPKRKYSRKKDDHKDQEATPVEVSESTTPPKKVCRRVLDFDENGEEVPLPTEPTTPKRKQSERKTAQRQGKEPIRDVNLPEIQYNYLYDHETMRWLYTTSLQEERMRYSALLSAVTFAGQGLGPAFGCNGYYNNFTSYHNNTSHLLTIEGQTFESNVLLDKIDTPTKKATVGHARYRKSSINNEVTVETRATKKNRVAKSQSLSADELWKKLYSIEGITEQFRLLNINRENSETGLILYTVTSAGNKMIPFTGGPGAMVPSTPVKKKPKPRAKVDLDNETDKVWNLLMENINGEGVDGSDEQKARWWEEERNVFRGRADSFIARMHLVQGDRRFTPWKGSVVDSVVGVFLTQNVSDHLSSSAFMSLASEYPIPSVPIRNCDVATPSLFRITYLDSEESMSNPPVVTHTDEEKEYVNSNDTSSSNDEIASSANESEKIASSLNESVEKIASSANESVGKTIGAGMDSVGESTVTYQNSSGSENNSKGEHYSSYVKLLQSLESAVQEPKGRETTSPGECSSSTSCCLNFQQGTTEKPPPGPGPGPASVDVKGKKKVTKAEKEKFDWDYLRREAQGREGKREKTARTMDSVDWEAIRTADVNEVAETIKSRGMNNRLAERIQGFLNRLLTDHGSLDLEWLRDVPPDKAKEYLLSFNGLGLKSVECVRLLTLHHLAFPVDTNVGRIAVRLGWVPLQPLPESLQLHLLEMYPILESIQKYLWPRLCKLDQKTLYELHYQMITFGKVFCTKSKPNCNACPMRGECRHFASAFASARLALPGTNKGTETPTPDKSTLPRLHLPEPMERKEGSQVVIHSELPTMINQPPTCCEPIIEEPASPEPPPPPQVTMAEIEAAFYEDPEEIPTIRLNMDALTNNLKEIMDGNMSTALVALTAEAASLPMPKLKNISQLRTEHRVYELPDTHPLIAKFEKREPDDPCSYLLAIWTPGETVDSVKPAVNKCISREVGRLCDEETCFACNSIKEARAQTVRGTILIPCRTAMRGSFPLNGTYFQVNEVFADHDSSKIPIDVPREWLWDLPRRTVYFGTSIPSIFKGLPTEIIQQCFWRGYVCVRGFERKTRAPRPLIARLHFPVSKMRSQPAANQPNPGAA